MYTEVYPIQIAEGMSMTGAYILLLMAPSVNKQVPVLIGDAEAQAIIMAQSHKEARRPLTHDLLSNIMHEYMLDLKQVTIDRFEEGIFYSTLYISDGIAEKHIDSRTSDAVVLALMNECPILMNDSVLQETSMEPGSLEGNLPQHYEDWDDLEHDELSLDELEEELKKCLEEEDYERAAEIQNEIDCRNDCNNYDEKD